MTPLINHLGWEGGKLIHRYFTALMVAALCAGLSLGGPPNRSKKCSSKCVARCNCAAQSKDSKQSKQPICPPQPMRTSSLVHQLKPNRVLIIAPLDRQDRLKEQMAMMHTLAGELRANSKFDVIESPRRVCEETFPIRTGQFDERKLVELGKRYSVDTVLYCNIEAIDAYSPMRLEIQFLAVNVEQSVAIVSGSQQFNLADPLTLECFYHSFGTDPEVNTTIQNSPTRLIDFGASHLAGDLSRVWK